MKTSGNPVDRRCNAFVQETYARAESLYGSIIRKATSDRTFQLTIYAVLIYENYCRPPVIRALERLRFWKKDRTTEVMQVASAEPLTDEESVKQGPINCTLLGKCLRAASRGNRCKLSMTVETGPRIAQKGV